MSDLATALEIARAAHANQVDKCGSPYIGHVTRVSEMGSTEEEMICGLLHDVVEDSDITFEYLTERGFSTVITDALRCLTKLSDDEDYDEFIQRVSKNKLAVAVKLNDLLDNMDIRRIDVLTGKDITRLNRYLMAYRYLLGEQNKFLQ